jgi:hypothetical protein
VYVISSSSSNIPPKVSIYSPADNAEYYEFDPVVISATASDLIGYVVNVDFYANNELIGSVSESPYTVEWTSMAGEYALTAIAYDNDGDSTISQALNISMIPAPSCRGTSWNGDFDFEFSPDNNNPTLTFIPSKAGVGTPTCILYYGTNANSLPGYNVTPNQPFQLSAVEGSMIYFYYTYSYPGEIERNNSQNKDTYEIGSCKNASGVSYNNEMQLKYYPNPVTNKLNLELPGGNNTVVVFNLRGERLAEFTVTDRFHSFEMSNFEHGVYIFKVQNGAKFKVFKVIK